MTRRRHVQRASRSCLRDGGAASYVDQTSYWVHAPSEVLLIAKYAL